MPPPSLPQEQPSKTTKENYYFYLPQYEQLLSQYDVKIGQPAVSKGGRSSDHHICRKDEDLNSLLRWTTFVENGPLYSVQGGKAYQCYWASLGWDKVSGWGPDSSWCLWLVDVCGFDSIFLS